MRIPLHRALLLTLGGTLLAALVVGGLTLDRRLAAVLEQDARDDLAAAPPLFIDRHATQAEMLRMHAGELAGDAGIAAAFESADRDGAAARAQAMAEAWPEGPVLVGPDGAIWLGPDIAHGIAPEATREGGPAMIVFGDGELHALALDRVTVGGSALGAAGVALPFDLDMARTMAGLTRTDIVFLGRAEAIVASTLDSTTTLDLLADVPYEAGREPSAGIVEAEIPGAGRFWATSVDLGNAGSALFVTSADRELEALPRLRRAGLLAAALALLVTLLVGLLVARQLSRPVRALARASRSLAHGDFESGLPASRIAEVDTVSRAFAEMRDALAARLGELADANRELAERQERLQVLQGQLIQRDRLVAAGRLVTELAHEIRNPVANVRNSLEVVRRHADSAKAREFTDLAIDELLRMHELAERMLDVNRPIPDGAGACDARAVVEDVAQLARLGDRDSRWEVVVGGSGHAAAAIPGDALKQVLLNLVSNAQDAMPEGGEIEIEIERDGELVVIEVRDLGRGIDPEVLPRIFDPFFTTKDEVHGVGLGLFIAEGVLRSHGGSLAAANREDGSGSTLRLTLPAADVEEIEESREASA